MSDAKAANRKIVPVCSYVGVFIQRNPEFADLVAAAG
ncbi:MAG: N-acetyltransferase [Candidatus Didemnitutus sp.]|nr:N-acetyltransferase [Candidatus Didemnitutus sp.]